MNRILIGAGLSLVCASLVSVIPAEVSQAQEITPESTPGAGAITPDTQPDGGTLPSNYGLVRSINGSTLQVQLLDGTSASYPLAGTIEPNSTLGIARGDLVGFDLDDSGTVTRVEPPTVSQAFEGRVTDIDGDQVTLTSDAGELLTTTIMPNTIARKGITPGKELIVTEYQGTWATKICSPKPPPVVEIPAIPPAPVGGPELPPPISEPIPALW